MMSCVFWKRIKPPWRQIGSLKRQVEPLERRKRKEEQGKWKKKGKGGRRKPAAASSSLVAEEKVGRF
jgi:hypothetical protein